MDDTSLELDLGLGYGPKPDNGCRNNKRQVVLDLSISHFPDDHAKSSRAGLKIDVEEDERKGIKNKISPNSSKEEDDDDIGFSNNGTRKKLRLTKDQTILLEDSFKQHCTLNMAQKQTLAQQLKLKPRQVEVWFQNRRARTKLKQTELNYQFLKKNCERLSEENLRLKKELLEIKSLASTEKTPQPLLSSFSYRIPEEAVPQRKCESCKKIEESNGDGIGK